MGADVPREFMGSFSERTMPCPRISVSYFQELDEMPRQERLTTSAPKSRKCRISSREVKAADMLKGISGTLSLIIFTGRERFPRLSRQLTICMHTRLMFLFCMPQPQHPQFLQGKSGHVTLDKRKLYWNFPCLGAESAVVFTFLAGHHGVVGGTLEIQFAIFRRAAVPVDNRIIGHSIPFRFLPPAPIHRRQCKYWEPAGLFC